MIDGLCQIQSQDLRNDIIILYDELSDVVDKHIFTKFSCRQIITNYVLGIGRPLCICDGTADLIRDGISVELLVDYQVTYGYKPYQSLDKPIHIYFRIDKNSIRNRKLDKILT
jgi:hypothetical protein